ncbi:hypothetical protein M0M57_14175 [Flavobacterium azooxidireducens]|uniref:Outer membrane protein beta-barrel domain-containing protein n=1 Tax=Flavobacterium azooxidireducens TaxID=1871076 RepID=A0ABY4KD87_9FLAO|nr:hypothetical protein [Flavobacterium azooxidireducens]UPQ78755.1 hypothetical protein M0M57_14175 [Flavobacterium azooxidireducens]
MKYKLLVITFVGIYAIRANAQNLALNLTSTESLFFNKDYSSVVNYTQRDSVKSKSTKFFIAYDFGEAAFNQFKSLGGEVGVRFINNHLLRLTHTNLHLTEKHLSSSFAKAVDGKNVKGKQFGFELFYDFQVFVKGLYIAPSVGYYENEYTHTILNEKLEKSSFTAGTAISFTEKDLFNVQGLYYRVSVPFRLNFDPIKETKLGDTTIKNNLFDNNIWLFVGFQF